MSKAYRNIHLEHHKEVCALQRKFGASHRKPSPALPSSAIHWLDDLAANAKIEDVSEYLVCVRKTTGRTRDAIRG
jgi:hypothetical protein